PVAEIAHELIGADRVSRPDVVGQNHLGVGIQRKPCPGVSPISGRIYSHTFSVTSHHCPKLVELNVCRTDVADVSVKNFPRIHRRSVQQVESGCDVRSSQSAACTNTGRLKHDRKSFRCRLRVSVVRSKLGVRVRECDAAGRTAVTLNMAFPVCPEFLGGIVFTADAGHSNLALSRRVAVIKSAWVGIAASPAMLIGPVYQLALGRGLVTLAGSEGFQPSISPFQKRVTTCEWARPKDRGIQELAFLNALHLNVPRWVSHSGYPFAWIELLKSLLFVAFPSGRRRQAFRIACSRSHR